MKPHRFSKRRSYFSRFHAPPEARNSLYSVPHVCASKKVCTFQLIIRTRRLSDAQLPKIKNTKHRHKMRTNAASAPPRTQTFVPPHPFRVFFTAAPFRKRRFGVAPTPAVLPFIIIGRADKKNVCKPDDFTRKTQPCHMRADIASDKPFSLRVIHMLGGGFYILSKSTGKIRYRQCHGRETL